MISFDTAAEAQAYVRDIIDVPVTERQETLGDGLQLHAFVQELEGDRFTNIYDVSYRQGEVTPAVRLHERSLSVYDFARTHGNRLVSGGGFEFLADIASGKPRQLAFNLAATDGRIWNLPVMDQEAVIVDGRRLSARPVISLGMMSLNGHQLSWSGSLTAYETDAKVFGSGNAVITHEHNDATGTVRVLDERSRFTPVIEGDDIVDMGFVARGDGTFLGKESSSVGGVDIFAHDIVVRCHERYLTDDLQLVVHSVDSIATGSSMQGALSAGPMLGTSDFESHPINKDPSLGSKPPFLERPLARIALYETEDSMVHMRLFDGRPGSGKFRGVTPTEAVQSIRAEGNIAWGCFLDPGQTAKLCVRIGNEVESLGNRHYLQWATERGGKYIWDPRMGRSRAGLITLQ